MVIDTLTASDRKARHEPVIYFYCNRNDPQRRDPTCILRAIVKQISIALPGLPKVVVAEYENRTQDGLEAGPLGFQECHELLVSLLDIFPQTTLLIDGLDESDPTERGRLLELLTTIIHSSTSVVRIFVSSRDDVDIKLKLEKVPNLYISAEDNKDDIERFIHRELAEPNTRLFKLPAPLKELIVETLVENANGMYVSYPE